MPLRVEPRRDRKLNRLVKAAEVRRLRSGHALFEPGEPAGHFYLVRSGYLRLAERGSPGRRERTVAVVGPWEVLGEECLGPGTRRYRCVAGETTTYQALEARPALLAIQSARHTFRALVEGLARDIEHARRLSTGASGPDARGRVALVLQQLAARWGKQRGKGVLVPHRLTHQVLADLAGVHRSTLTTTLNDWLFARILGSVPRGILLADPGRVAELAGRR